MKTYDIDARVWLKASGNSYLEAEQKAFATLAGWYAAGVEIHEIIDMVDVSDADAVNAAVKRMLG